MEEANSKQQRWLATPWVPIPVPYAQPRYHFSNVKHIDTHVVRTLPDSWWPPDTQTLRQWLQDGRIRAECDALTLRRPSTGPLVNLSD